MCTSNIIVLFIYNSARKRVLFIFSKSHKVAYLVFALLPERPATPLFNTPQLCFLACVS